MIDINRLGTPALAYLGDAVLEVLVREALVLKGFEKSSTLNKEALKYVTAVNQCKAFANIEGLLTETELGVFRRGKNSSHLNIPKSASPTEYKIATGFEAILGFLKLNNDSNRINELFAVAYPDLQA
jgi:ribonuclease-3 family protein